MSDTKAPFGTSFSEPLRAPDEPVSAWPAIFALGGIVSLRMMGLFMILPVLILHAPNYAGYTPILAGLAIGIHGLAQGLAQTPMGFLSDRIGRKPVIAAGLVIFFIGSVLAATADHLWTVIAGRALQGAGAVAAAAMAFASDLSHETHRNRAMAIIGAGIGISFMLSLVFGPLVAGFFGLKGVFWACALLALIALFLLGFALRAPKRRFPRSLGDARGSTPKGRSKGPAGEIAAVLRDRQMMTLCIGIFVIHAIMTAAFVSLPIVIEEVGLVDPAGHWKIYASALLLSLAPAVWMIVISDRGRRGREVVISAGLMLSIALLGLTFAQGASLLIGSMIVFFVGFNTLEACLPAMMSQAAPMQSRGTCLGVFATLQCLGIFVGGLSGGALLGMAAAQSLFAPGAVLLAGWVLIALGLKAAPLSGERAGG
ncbi:MFS transporter [Thioalkalivibrio sp. HK1]|uniref:MFS transporter n=1 Tax=Thioalkalivibrio sp. HK1 TaxID=1469245 RepID=UPI00046E5D24|nr:MFS transporter [Thioalkalivibrio sp. HK1]